MKRFRQRPGDARKILLSPIAISPGGLMNAPAYFCHRCGSQLRWVDQYRSWWCDRCQAYTGQTGEQQISNAIDDFGRSLDRALFSAPAPPLCGRCNRHARWIPEYQRWWCDGCGSYL